MTGEFPQRFEAWLETAGTDDQPTFDPTTLPADVPDHFELVASHVEDLLGVLETADRGDAVGTDRTDVSEDDRRVAASILAALAEYRPGSLLSEPARLVAGLDEPDPDIRAQMAAVVMHTASTFPEEFGPHVDAIGEAAADTEERVREAAVKTLFHLEFDFPEATARHLPAVAETLDSLSPFARTMAFGQWCSQLAREYPDRVAAQIPALVDALDAETDVTPTASILALGRLVETHADALREHVVAIAASEPLVELIDTYEGRSDCHQRAIRALLRFIADERPEALTDVVEQLAATRGVEQAAARETVNEILDASER